MPPLESFYAQNKPLNNVTNTYKLLAQMRESCLERSASLLLIMLVVSFSIYILTTFRCNFPTDHLLNMVI